MGDDTQNDSELAEETELGSEMAGHSAEMSSILGDAYLFSRRESRRLRRA